MVDLSIVMLVDQRLPGKQPLCDFREQEKDGRAKVGVFSCAPPQRAPPTLKDTFVIRRGVGK